MLGALLLAFLAGFLFLALAQICIVYLIFKRFLKPRLPRSASSSRSLLFPLSVDPASSASRNPHLFLQGDIWVAPVPFSVSRKDSIKVSAPRERVAKDSKKKNGSDDCPEINPTRRHARLEDKILIFVADDGTEERIDMTGCSVLSVSGGKESSRKWAKKYPIKLESKGRQLLAGSSTCLLYLETAWDKEAWCQVLRAASRWASNTEDWYIKQKKEFHEYFLDFYKTYPSFSKLVPCRWDYGLDEKPKLIKPELLGLSRRQKIWKKFTKKGSSKGSMPEPQGGSSHEDSKRSSLESKSSNGCEELNYSVHLQSQAEADEKHDSSAADGSSGQLDPERVLMEEQSAPSGFQRSLESVIPPKLLMDAIDQGTMCWNMLFSRLFFDSYKNSKFQDACNRLIQKQLSKITTPGYIGGISCTKLELGKTPPFFHSIQILPKDLDSIWSFEVGIEYAGGARLKLATRLDVNDPLSQEIVLNQSLQPTLAGAAAADILRRGLESIDKTVKFDGNVAQVTFDSESTGTLDPRSGDAKISKASSGDVGLQPSKGGWKAVLSRVAGQVSQVPFTLSLRLLSLKGTIRVQIKAPPTDRIWFGFTSMPTIDLEPEPSIGDHKITTSAIATFITNRIKMLVQDMLILPNCESVFVPWMISENNDWIPQSDMPVPWSPHDSSDILPPTDEAQEASVRLKDNGKSTIMKETQSATGVGKSDISFGKNLPGKKPISSRSGDRDLTSEMKRPLLETLDSASEASLQGNMIPHVAARQQETSSSDHPSSKFSSNAELEEKGRQSSKRFRMLNLGKKVWEMLDEKGQSMLERVREGFEKNEQAGE